MAKKYKIQRKIIELGGCLVIAIPRLWARREGLGKGDTVDVLFDSEPFLKILAKGGHG